MPRQLRLDDGIDNVDDDIYYDCFSCNVDDADAAI